MLQCSGTTLGRLFTVLLCSCMLSASARQGAVPQIKVQKAHGLAKVIVPHAASRVEVDSGTLHFLQRIALPSVSEKEAEIGGKPKDDGSNKALGTVKPMSATLWCIINITIQYLCVYTCLAFVKLWSDHSDVDYPRLEKVLKNAAHTVTYGPALCVLLLGCRMRVNWLTGGQGHCPLAVQICMYACTAAITINTCLVLIFPVFVKEGLSVCDKTGDPHPDFGVDHFVLKIILNIVRYLFLMVLYGGVAGIIVGMICYIPPKEQRPDPIPPVSPAVACTMNMSMQFFLVYFFVAIARTVSEIKGHKTHFETVMIGATHTVNMAPMLCMLFLSARMRALQVDPVHGHPQEWAQSCFYMCAYSIFCQAVLAIIVPIVMRGDVASDNYGVQDMKFMLHGSHKYIGYSLAVARYAITICLYAGFFAVIISIFTYHPHGTEYRPVSPTLLCVVNLALQFFLIYFVLWTLLSMKELLGYEAPRVFRATESARITVMFAPILSILFVAMKMRALSLSNNQRAPPTWAVIAMYLATFAVALQFLSLLLMASFGDVVITHDGNISHRSKHSAHSSELSAGGRGVSNVLIDHPVGRIVIMSLRILSMCLFYGGVVTVMIAIIIMTPEMTVGAEQAPQLGHEVW